MWISRRGVRVLRKCTVISNPRCYVLYYLRWTILPMRLTNNCKLNGFTWFFVSEFIKMHLLYISCCYKTSLSPFLNVWTNMWLHLWKPGFHTQLILIIWNILAWEGKQMLAWNWPWFFSYLQSIYSPTIEWMASWIAHHFR